MQMTYSQRFAWPQAIVGTGNESSDVDKSHYTAQYRTVTVWIRLFGPDSGSQACGDVGYGRMLEPPAMLRQSRSLMFIP